MKLWFLLVFSVSFSATMASTPLTIANFGIATPGTVLLNLFLVTMAGIAIQLGTASLLSGIVSLIILSTGFNFLAKSLVGMMEWLVGSALSIPGFFREAEMRHALLGPAGILIMIGVLLACHHWRPRLRWHFFWIPPASFASYLAMTVVPA